MNVLRSFLAAPGIENAFLAGDSGEDTFYTNIRLPNGTFKTTAHGRLADVDAWLCQCLGPTRALRVMDVGISSAVTTLELSHALSARGFVPTVTGIDLYPTVDYLALGPIRVLTEGDHVYQVEIGPLHIPNTLSLGSKLIQAVYAMARGLTRLAAGKVRRVPFVTPEARHGGIEVTKADIIDGPLNHLGGGFDLVRAMNVLNPGYFPESSLAKAVSNIHRQMADGGFFLIGRTVGDTTSATLYRATPDGFFRAGHFGVGSEIDDLVLSSRPPTADAPSRPESREPT